MNAMNIERSPEFVDLTARKAWTAMDVRRLLPDVSCIVPEAQGMTARTGIVSGRGCDFATVRIVNNPAPDYIAEFAWSTIAAALNNNRALRF